MDTTQNVIPIRNPDQAKIANLEAINAELTNSNGRLIASLSAHVEALSVGISSITAVITHLSQEEFDRLFNSIWTLHYRAVVLVERIAISNEQPIDLTHIKCLKHPEARKANADEPG